MRKLLTREDIEEIVRQYEQGRGVAYLAGAYHCASSTIKKVLTDRGVTLTDRGVTLRGVGRPPRKPTTILVNAYHRHGSVPAAAKAEAMSPAGMAYRLAKANVLPQHPAADRLKIASVLTRAVDRGDPDECWLARGSRTTTGYVRLALGPVKVYAHRLAWQQANGRAIPPGMHIAHLCDRPPCANPKHLVLATPSENSRQMLDRGRSGRAKLTPDDVREIRRLRSLDVPVTEIAPLYPQVGRSQLASIVAGRSWAGI